MKTKKKSHGVPISVSILMVEFQYYVRPPVGKTFFSYIFSERISERIGHTFFFSPVGNIPSTYKDENKI